MFKLSAVLLAIALAQGSQAWKYGAGDDGTSSWRDSYPACGGERQSPIDINTMDAEYQSDLYEFQFHGYDSTSGLELKLKNNGHAAQVDIVSGSLMVTGGNLLEPYHLAQFHFHWGADNGQGSEHTINGTEYPMEVHFVHYAEQHGDLGTAADKPGGLAVLGFFFKEGSHNAHFDEIIDNLEDITMKNDEMMLTPFKIMSLLPGEGLDHYYRYDGSLTTPGCYESVIWTVFKPTITVSSDQLMKFRSLKGENGTAIVDNYRPVQGLEGRVVHTSIDNRPLPPPASATGVVASFIATLAIAVFGKLIAL